MPELDAMIVVLERWGVAESSGGVGACPLIALEQQRRSISMEDT